MQTSAWAHRGKNKEKETQGKAEEQMKDPVQFWESVHTYVWGGVGSPSVLLVEQLILLPVMKYVIVSQQKIY